MKKGRPMKRQEAIDFRMFLKNCTDAQVFCVWQKETDAKRWEYAALAEAEAEVRAGCCSKW